MHVKTYADRVFLNPTYQDRSQDLGDESLWTDSSQKSFVNPLGFDHTQKVKWYIEWTAEVSLRTNSTWYIK